MVVTSRFQDKFIAFVYIIGFKNMVERAEKSDGSLTLDQINDFCAKLGTSAQVENIIQYGPTICPESPHQRRDLSFRITQISDCVVASAEVSPAGVINLLYHCWGASLALLSEGVLVRGFVTRGSIYYEGQNFIGSGYQHAYQREGEVSAFRRDADERGTPFIEMDRSVVDYIDGCANGCVKEMYSRFVEGDGQVQAIYPFKRITPQFVIDSSFDATAQKRSVEELKRWLTMFRSRVIHLSDPSNRRAMEKIEHYVSAIERQLDVCDEAIKFIDGLSQPFPKDHF